MPELHLDGAGAQRGIAEAAAVARHVQGDPLGVGREDPARADPASVTVTWTRRPAARRQCLGSVSGRSTPGEETSSV